MFTLILTEKIWINAISGPLTEEIRVGCEEIEFLTQMEVVLGPGVTSWPFFRFERVWGMLVFWSNNKVISYSLIWCLLNPNQRIWFSVNLSQINHTELQPLDGLLHPPTLNVSRNGGYHNSRGFEGHGESPLSELLKMPVPFFWSF